MRPASIFRLLAVLLGSVGAAACDGIFGCTDAGCGSPVTVEVVGAPADVDYAVVVEAPSGAMLQLSCFENVCSVFGGSDGFGTPDVVTVTYEDPDTTIVRELEPVWRTSYPNGRSCGPTCRATTLRFVVE